MTLGETPRLFRTTSRCRGYAVSRRARPLTYKRKLRPHRRHRRQRRPDRQRRAAPTHGRRPGGAVSPPLRRPRDGRAGRRFDHDRFYAEVRRVLKPGGALAGWTYGLLQVTPSR